jgi:plastocyanin
MIALRSLVGATLLIALTEAYGVGRHSYDPAIRQAVPGSIEGQIVLPPRPVLRTAERYADGSPGADRPVQAVPTVVYIKDEAGDMSPAPAGERPRLAQQDTTFVPAALVITVGTTVDFPNRDPFFHNVFSYSKTKRFDLGRYPRGESKEVRFDSPGIVKVYCEVHKSMRSLVAVVASPFHAVADSLGRFAIRDVPPGRHELIAVDSDRGSRSVMVNVLSGETAKVTVPF